MPELLTSYLHEMREAKGPTELLTNNIKTNDYSYSFTRIFSFIQVYLNTSNNLEYFRTIWSSTFCSKLSFHTPPGLFCLMISIEEKASYKALIVFIVVKALWRYDSMLHGLLHQMVVIVEMSFFPQGIDGLKIEVF